MSKNNIKVLPPRPLTNEETTHSLSQWRINFKQYCKKDDNFKHFLATTTTWNFGAENAGMLSELGVVSGVGQYWVWCHLVDNVNTELVLAMETGTHSEMVESFNSLKEINTSLMESKVTMR